jgi:DNA modification methylase
VKSPQNLKPAAGRLRELEAVIERGKQTYMQVGAALSEIREQRLYRQLRYRTFEEYCRSRWNWSRSYVNRQIRAYRHLVPLGTNTPVNERQARARLVEMRSPQLLTYEDDVPKFLENPVTRIGDVWILGEHRVMCGNATDQHDMERLMDGEQADCEFTDFPYNAKYRSFNRYTHRPMANDDLSSEAFEKLIFDACAILLGVSRGGIYICMSSAQMDTLKRVFVDAGGHWSTFIIWGKNQPTMGWSHYHHRYEMILYGWRKGISPWWCGSRAKDDLWMVDRPSENDLHPTMKPVELIKLAVWNSCPVGGIVLDPFAGSGSTLIACVKTGRRARMMEIEPLYCDVIVQRWEQATGKKAILDGDGRAFEELRHTPRTESN